MKLYGIWVAQDEGDVIGDVLRFFRQERYFEEIFFYDLGSSDDTLAIASDHADVLRAPRRLRVPYSGALRVELMDRHRPSYQDGDWIAIIDSDELYAEDPRPLIEQAEREGAVRIETHQVMHHFTDLDLEQENLGRPAPGPVEERLLHYVINWSEIRFYKYLDPGRTRDGRSFDLEGRCCSRRLLNRHYPYRSSRQIQDKIRVRLANREAGGNAQYQIFSDDWRDYVVDHRLLHRFDGAYRFGLPEGLDWKRYYNPWNNDSTGWKSVAHNNTYIHWLMSHGYLRPWTPSERLVKALGKGVQYLRGRHKQLGVDRAPA